MKRLKHHMSPKEARCYLALKRWQRKHLRHHLLSAIKPKFLFGAAFSGAHAFGKCLIVAANVVLLPVLLLWWLARIIVDPIFLSMRILKTYMRGSGLSAPGERNINGMHYKFITDIELPCELYIGCINEWVEILYGQDQATQHRLENYLFEDYLQKLKREEAKDELAKQILKTQMRTAREDLSAALGHY